MNSHYIPAIILIATSLILLLLISLNRSHKVSFSIFCVGVFTCLFTLSAQIQASPLHTALFYFNPTTSFLSCTLLLFISFFSLQLYQWINKLSEHKDEYYLLLILANLGALTIIASNHFASFFIGLELLSLSLIGLIAYCSNQNGQEAAVKYLILSAVASALILMGIGLVYLQYGTLLFSDLKQTSLSLTELPWVSTVSALFIISGLFFKLSLVPCHLWVADVFDGSPLPTTVMLATLSKLAAFVILWRLYLINDWANNPYLSVIVGFVAIASMLIGNLLGVLQSNLLRLLAFSSIAHFGYLLIITLILNTPESSISLSSELSTNSFHSEALTFYLLAYLFTLIGSFTVLMQLPNIKNIEQLKGILWHHPLMAITLALTMLSLAGIPLTVGFMGKFYVVMAAVNGQLWWLLSALVVGSVIGLFYYLRVIMVMIKQPQNNDSMDDIDTNYYHNTMNIIVIITVLGLGIFPTELSEIVRIISEK